MYTSDWISGMTRVRCDRTTLAAEQATPDRRERGDRDIRVLLRVTRLGSVLWPSLHCDRGRRDAEQGWF